MIDAPCSQLKGIQRELAVGLRSLVSSPIAFDVKGRDQIRAARLHERAAWVGTVDIAGFYPAIGSDRVRALYLKNECDSELADYLTQLTTYEGRLPQGAPTSPAIANLLLKEFDERVAATAKRLGVAVTRFGDDMIFSGRSHRMVALLSLYIRRELAALGLRDNAAKRSIKHRGVAMAYGLSLGNGVSIPKDWRRTVRDLVRRVGRLGCTEAERSRLLGKVAYIERLHPKEGRRLRAILLAAVCSPSRSRRTPRLHNCSLDSSCIL